MDLLALSLGKALCDASTAIVYAARCTDLSAMRPIGYVALLLAAVVLAVSASRATISRLGPKTRRTVGETP